MKILLYSQNIGKPTINFIHNEIQYLQQDHDLLVLSHFISDENPIEIKNLTRIRHYENRKIGKLLRLANRFGIPAPSFEKDFNKIVDEFNPEAIHIHFGNIADRILDYFHRTDIPVFITFHGHDASTKLVDLNYRNRLNKLFERPNIHPVFVSKFMQENMHKHDVHFQHYHILHCGIDMNRFHRQKNNHPKTPFTFLQVSSFVEKKGHIDTLKAYRKFIDSNPEHNTQLILGGGGNGLDEIKELCKELKLDNHITFKGWVTSDQTKELMENAHAFLHHSVIASNKDMEGIPTVIMEAMAMELPIISTYHSGIPELVENGVNGYLVEEHDIETYALRMKEILDWKYLEKNRLKIIDKFEKIKHGEDQINIYKQYLTT